LSPPLVITNTQARQLFLSCQGLSTSPRGKLTNDGLLEMITRLGFVQVDSINTVARAHHMILFARNQTYRPHQLTHLLEKQRSLFEHWTHDAAVVPTIFYPYWRHRFHRDAENLRRRWRKWRREGFEETLSAILDMVARTGPTRARDIGSKANKGTGWWDWHPEKTALEFHWRTGNLAISGRDGFQKIYDLAQNVIPEIYRTDQVSENQFLEWACHAALTRLGTATPGEIAAFWGLLTAKEAASWCQKQISNGVLIDVLIAPSDGGRPNKALAFSNLPDQLSTLPEPPERVRILSPFDPLIRDRKRCLRLFGFDYRIEVFVPQAKRHYGYYVFPLLQGQRFIGRIDMKRIDDALVVAGLWLEPGVKMSKGRKAALEAELNRYRRFVGAQTVSTHHTGLGLEGILNGCTLSKAAAARITNGSE